MRQHQRHRRRHGPRARRTRSPARRGTVASFTGQAGGGVMDVVFQGNTVSNTHAGERLRRGRGGHWRADGGGDDVDGSMPTASGGADGDTITLFKAASGSLLSGTVSNNTIGVMARGHHPDRERAATASSSPPPGPERCASPGEPATPSCSTARRASYKRTIPTAATPTNFTITGNTTAQPSAEALAGAGGPLTNGAPSSRRHHQRLRRHHGQQLQRGAIRQQHQRRAPRRQVGAGTGHTFRLPGYVGTTARQRGRIRRWQQPARATVLVQTDSPVTAAAVHRGRRRLPVAMMKVWIP